MTDLIDDLDRAAALTQAHNEACVTAIQAQNKPQQERNPDGTWPVKYCVSCGDDIPDARLEMGKIRCVLCQAKDEQQRRMYGG